MIAEATELVDAGADLLDIGGQTASPAVAEISIDEELTRVLPVIEALAAELPQVPLSVDTYRLEVAEAALQAVKVQPAQRQLLATQNNNFGVAWQISASAGYTGGVSSAAAQVINPATGAVLATIGGPLSRSGSGPYLLSEFLDIPESSVQAWTRSGLQRLLLVRIFTGGTTVRGQMTLTLASSALRAPREASDGELLVQRLSLSFLDNQRIKLVQPGTDLKAKVLLAYSGNGLLEGRWQVAEPGSTEGRPVYRTLTLVRSYLGNTQQAQLNSPVLPTEKAGKYRVRFRVSNRDQVPADDLVLDNSCPIPELTVETVYEVLGGEDPTAQVVISSGPQSGTVNAATEFHWQALPAAVVYQLQLFASSNEQAESDAMLGDSPRFVAGMLLPANTAKTQLSVLMRSKMEAGQYYLWRVTAHDQSGALIGRSREWRVRYQP